MDVIGTCKALALMSAITNFSNGHLHTSMDGIKRILSYESCRLKPYLCSAGVWTDGVGNTFDVKPGFSITETHAAKDFVDNLKHFEKQLYRLLPYEVSQPTWDALVSFSYNIGMTQFKKSTLLKRIYQGRMYDACMEMRRWVYVKNKRLNGLVRRREEESFWCLVGIYHPVKPYEMDIMDLLNDFQYRDPQNFSLYFKKIEKM